jgi:hypothetical protein
MPPLTAAFINSFYNYFYSYIIDKNIIFSTMNINTIIPTKMLIIKYLFLGLAFTKYKYNDLLENNNKTIEIRDKVT